MQGIPKSQCPLCALWRHCTNLFSPQQLLKDTLLMKAHGIVNATCLPLPPLPFLFMLLHLFLPFPSLLLSLSLSCSLIPLTTLTKAICRHLQHMFGLMSDSSLTNPSCCPSLCSPSHTSPVSLSLSLRVTFVV